jgi:hypothetical protein
MQETWDVSALIDKGMRIHEARGATMQHLGMELQHIAHRAFIDFVTPAQRAWFRRCIAKVTAGEELGIIAADFQTGAVAARPFFLTARPANAHGKWWLMLTANLPEALRAAVRGPESPTLASGYEFVQLVEGAAQLMSERLDLVRVNAGILADEAAVAPEIRANLQVDFDRIILDDSYEGIASRMGAGEYLLLRERKAAPAILLAKLGAATEGNAIPQSKLCLETSALPLSSLGPNLNPAGIRRAVANLRHLAHGTPAQGAKIEQPFWLRPAVLSVGLVPIIGIAWLII